MIILLTLLLIAVLFVGLGIMAGLSEINDTLRAATRKERLGL